MTQQHILTATLDVVRTTLQEIRPLLMKSHGSISHTKKDDNSSVTELDVFVERKLKQAISSIDDTVGFYGEEFGPEGSTEQFWTIDPIDGTEAYIRGLPFCSNMLAYIKNGEVIASIIYDFVQDEYYQAVRGSGAFCNDKPIQVSERDISHACIEFEIKHQQQIHRDMYFDLPRFSTVKFSAAGYGFCQVARGRIEARVIYNAYGKIWDYAPGSLLVKEAGGQVSNIGLNSYEYFNLNFIASNQKVHSEIQNYFAQTIQ